VIRVVRLGTPRAKAEGVRLGTVRRPPRGVPKSEFARRDFYDVWLPELSPSQALVSKWLAATTDAERKRCARAFRRELEKVSHIVDALAALSQTADFAVGCYCEDEAKCHRSVLREVFAERGADVA
jgi:uncharacterized protein YeaO (DUF488 family)